LLSGAAFLAGLAVLTLLFWQADAFVRIGLEGRLYYVALVPVGLAAATFLFGILRSYAVYKGKVFGGFLELGGPLVAFLLVTILGFVLVPNSSTFPVTVYLYREDAASVAFLRGNVILRLDGDPRAAQVSGKGEAYFIGVPAKFRGQSVDVELQGAEGYEAAQDTLVLGVEGAHLAVRARPAEFSGYVKAADGHPLPGARVSLAGHSVQTDANGYFKLTVPGTEVERGASLQVAAFGYAPWSHHVSPGGNEITALMDKAKPENRGRP
jgi:hypothetical protein